MNEVDHDKQRKQIAQRLRKARKRKGLTQVQVQKITGVNSKTLSGYENKVSEPDLITLSLLAACYEVSTDWIINEVEHNSKLNRVKEALQKLLDDVRS